MKKRPLLVITGTVLGTVGVLSYVPGSTTANPMVALAPISTRSAAPISTPTPSASTVSPTTQAPTPTTQAAAPKGSSSPRAVAAAKKKAHAAKVRAKPPRKPATPKPTPAATTTTSRKIAGSAIQTPFGPVQVQITVQGTKIISVRALQSPQGGRSSEISRQAVPYLVQQTLAAQSANVQGVSGATYTSDAWAQSLQSALSNI
jgi:uncharacterized protein with FMN-binding domain